MNWLKKDKGKAVNTAAHPNPSAGIQQTSHTTTTSQSFLLRKPDKDYNPNGKSRDITLLWRRMRGIGGRDAIIFSQTYSHWGLEITSHGGNDGYVWELRKDPTSNRLLASASSLNMAKSSWRGQDIKRMPTGLRTTVTDTDLMFRAQIVVDDMRHPRITDNEHLYSQYNTNCHRYARSLAMNVCLDARARAQMEAFFQRQGSFGDKNHDIKMPYLQSGQTTVSRSEIAADHDRRKGHGWYPMERDGMPKAQGH